MTTELEKQFTGTGEVKGYIFTQVHESENAYIYMVTDPDTYKVRQYHYEVFERRQTPVCIDFENRIYSDTDFKEIYPKAKDFGVWAWTCPTFEKCMEYVDQINETVKQRQ